MQAGGKILWAVIILLAFATLPACSAASTPPGPALTPFQDLVSAEPLASSTNLPLTATLTSTPAAPAPALTSTPTLTLVKTPAPSPTSGPLVLEYGAWDHVLSLAWSPDGDLLAAGVSRKVYLYNTQDLSTPHILDIGGWATSLSFSPSLGPASPAARLLAISLRDGSVQVWDTGTLPDASESRPICKLEVHRKGANHVAFSPDGLSMATTGNDAMVRLWDIPDLLEQGSCKLDLKAEMIGGARSVPDIQFHPLGFNLASVDLSVVRLREVATQRLVTTFRAEQMLRSIAFSPSGDLLASAGVGDLVQVWQVDSGGLYRSLHLAPASSPPSNAFVWELAFSPQGDWLAAAANDGRLHFWKLDVDPTDEEGYPFFTLDAHRRAATCLAFSPDGTWLASGSLDASLRLWSITEMLGD